MNRRSMVAALLLLYGATGITALAYEVLWTRMLSLMFGISIFGVVVTVTAFMAGLGIGSYWLADRARRAEPLQALRLLGLLEGGVAIYALLLPLLMPLIDRALLTLGGSLSLAGWQLLQGSAVLLLLVPAAMAMGMAFPAALRVAASLRVPLAAMYGVNALGGSIGALLPLWLLPHLGWQRGLWWVAGFGLLLAAAAWLLAAQWWCIEDELPQHVADDGVVKRPPLFDLLAYGGIGAAALMLEVLWTREYGMVLLRTEYILAVLLCVYLLGIGLGSLLAPRRRHAFWLNLFPVVAAVAVVVAQYFLAAISQWAATAQFSALWLAMLAEGGVVALCTLPVTLLLGAWLPLLTMRFYSDSDETAGGWWYGANSAGAAAGALLAGFVLLPLCGTATSILLAALLLLLCGMRWVTDRRLWLALPLLLLIAWPLRHLPAVADLLPSLKASVDRSIYEDAVSLTHVVEQANGQRLLLSDLQRMDASTEPTAVTVQKNQARLPLLLHHEPHSLLLLGLGTGITAAGSLPFATLHRRVAVELSQGAIDAAGQWFAPVNGGVTRQMRVVRDDARRFLRRRAADGGAQYDVIIGDLFHPDMVGRANLLSRQQFARAAARLRKGGVFAQWLALNQFDVKSLQVILHTFASVFTHNALFVDGYRVAMVGFKGEMPLLSNLVRHLHRTQADALPAMSGGEGAWTWYGRYWGAIPTLSTPLQDEWAPVIEYRLPKVRYGAGVDMVAMWDWLLSWRAHDVEAAHLLGVSAADMQAFKRARVATALDVRLWKAELTGDERRVVEMARLARRANPEDRWPAFALADRMFDSLSHRLPDGMSREQALARILDIRPDHEGAIHAMLQLAREHGDAARIHYWQQQLAAVSPLAKDVGGR